MIYFAESQSVLFNFKRNVMMLTRMLGCVLTNDYYFIYNKVIDPVSIQIQV